MISVVIPLYNKEKRIAATLSSVIEQEGNFEIIVVDDGSTDKSVRVVESINDKRIRLVSQSNGGPSKARNIGAKAAIGEWILFLDADDELLPDALKTFSKYVNKYPKEKCFAANFYSVNNNRRRIYSPFYYEKIIIRPHWAWDFCGLFPRTGTLLVHKSVTNDFLFNNELRRFEDAEWLFRIMRRYNFVRISQPVMLYCEDSLAASKNNKNINEDYLGHLDLNNGSWGERLAVFQLYKQAKKTYKKESKNVYDGQLTSTSYYILTFMNVVSKLYALLVRIFAKVL
jgi:glycosyltransferase involved in cell wall biosynthesis